MTANGLKQHSSMEQMPILEAFECASCGVPVNVGNRKNCGSDVYRCLNCFEVSTCHASHVVYAPTALTPKWVEAIGVVSFDLELGQTLTHLCPPLPFSLAQETDLAFLCFPDANSTACGRDIHHFIYSLDKRYCDHTRTSIERPAALSSRKNSPQCKTEKSTPAEVQGVYQEEYFCSSFYRRKRDPSIQRGAQQKAVVIISMYFFPRIFGNILESCSDELLNSLDTETSLREIYEDISRWPNPLPTMRCSGFTLKNKKISDFRIPYYTPERFGPQWCESGRGYKQRQRIARAQLLQLLESPVPDTKRIQEKLNECVKGPNAHDEFFNGMSTELKLELPVSKWSPVDYLSVIRCLRIGKTKVNLSSIGKEISDVKLISGAASIAALFRCKNNWVSSEIAVIQNLELRQSREFAKELLCRAEKSSVLLQSAMADDLLAGFDIHSVLLPHLNRLWKLWELIILGEPLCIVGKGVKRVSTSCFCLYSLVAPMLFNGIVRPYLTINNSELDYLKPDECSKIPMIAGATNPFFVRHWKDSPHFLSLGDLDEDELQTHKTLPHSSSKRFKLQFEHNSCMFTSRHFCVKSEKHVWDRNDAEVVPNNGNRRGSFESITSANESSSLSKVIRRTFLRMTKEFLLPLEQFLEHEFGKFPASLFFEDHTPSNDTILTALRHGDKQCLPVHMFKRRQDMFDVYVRFMNTSTYKSWVEEKIQALRRAVILDATSLENFFLLESNPEKRYDMIMSLQYMLVEQIERPILDVKLLQKLVELTECLIPLRSILTQR